jgi:putative lipoic acid-binding regulatory protein
MSEDKFAELKKKLDETVTYPSVYMFKFILPADNRTIALVENMFGEGAEIYTKESGKGKYISITVKEVMMNTDEIIVIYKRAGDIPGVMLL